MRISWAHWHHRCRLCRHLHESTTHRPRRVVRGQSEREERRWYSVRPRSTFGLRRRWAEGEARYHYPHGPSRATPPLPAWRPGTILISGGRTESVGPSPSPITIISLPEMYTRNCFTFEGYVYTYKKLYFYQEKIPFKYKIFEVPNNYYQTSSNLFIFSD